MGTSLPPRSRTTPLPARPAAGVITLAGEPMHEVGIMESTLDLAEQRDPRDGLAQEIRRCVASGPDDGRRARGPRVRLRDVPGAPWPRGGASR